MSDVTLAPKIKLPQQAMNWIEGDFKMNPITCPTEQQVKDAIEGVLGSLPADVGFAIGVASPQFAPSTGIFFFVGNLLNYKQEAKELSDATCFEIASNTKIFTAALLTHYSIKDPNLLNAKVVSYHPRGMPALPSSFSDITLLELANYTSGLPEDDKDATDQPEHMPQPYNALSMYASWLMGTLSFPGRERISPTQISGLQFSRGPSRSLLIERNTLGSCSGK